jgi:branched-chain amino acid transport system ATP-binding protein
LPQILSFLRKWAETGTAVVIVEQHLQVTAPYADRAMIVERGKVKFECPAAELDARLAAEAALEQAGAGR